jgi:AraC-like DNA-binding protein
MVFVLFSVTEILTAIFNIKKFNPDTYSVISFLFISYFGYASFWQRDIYKVAQTIPAETAPVLPPPDAVSALQNSLPQEDFHEQTKKQHIPDDYIQSVAENLHRLLIAEKPYLNSNLALDELAGMIKIHRNLLSKVINDHYKMNFFNFINKYRIEEAAEMLKSDKFMHLSIEGIAQSVGFNSKSVFNPAFKKIMGITPSEYRKKFLNQS